MKTPTMGTPERALRAADPEGVEEPCAACGAKVRLLVVRTPEGSPDLVRPSFPDTSWIGWIFADEDGRRVQLLVLCSRACVVEWVDLEHGPGL